MIFFVFFNYPTFEKIVAFVAAWWLRTQALTNLTAT